MELLQHGARVDHRAPLARLADARELEQVVDQRLHRAPGLLDPIHEVQPGVVEARAVVLAQQPGEAEQRDQRRAQIVRERAARSARGPRSCAGAPRWRPVDRVASRSERIIALRQARLGRERRARRRRPRAGCRRGGAASRSSATPSSPASSDESTRVEIPRRAAEQRDRTADQLRGACARSALDRAIRVAQQALRIDHHDRVGRAGEQRGFAAGAARQARGDAARAAARAARSRREAGLVRAIREREHRELERTAARRPGRRSRSARPPGSRARAAPSAARGPAPRFVTRDDQAFQIASDARLAVVAELAEILAHPADADRRRSVIRTKR